MRVVLLQLLYMDSAISSIIVGCVVYLVGRWIISTLLKDSSAAKRSSLSGTNLPAASAFLTQPAPRRLQYLGGAIVGIFVGLMTAMILDGFTPFPTLLQRLLVVSLGTAGLGLGLLVVYFFDLRSTD